ncbi:MAG: hypothetical protein Q9219_001722 [cf. Caloplaca sp. 3 TL-2023]
MGKSKKQRHHRSTNHPYSKDLSKSKAKGHNKPKEAHSSTTRNTQQSPTIPFSPTDHILLVGEGDFSFARSLFYHHKPRSLVATCYDSAARLAEKYPQSTDLIRDLEDAADEDESTNLKILYNVDATRLGKGGSTGGGKAVARGGFDKLAFNFPHVGGLTKDVNRQHLHGIESLKRYAELLVNFFKAAVPLLAIAGTIIVTIFEGEPYSLWNIRDLARHVGLKVGRSFRFQAEAYPGYQHVRTLGNIEGGHGWKGEDRPARTYIFERKDDGAIQPPLPKQKNRAESSSSDDDDD